MIEDKMPYSLDDLTRSLGMDEKELADQPLYKRMKEISGDLNWGDKVELYVRSRGSNLYGEYFVGYFLGVFCSVDDKRVAGPFLVIRTNITNADLETSTLPVNQYSFPLEDVMILNRLAVDEDYLKKRLFPSFKR